MALLSETRVANSESNADLPTSESLTIDFDFAGGDSWLADLGSSLQLAPPMELHLTLGRPSDTIASTPRYSLAEISDEKHVQSVAVLSLPAVSANPTVPDADESPNGSFLEELTAQILRVDLQEPRKDISATDRSACSKHPSLSTIRSMPYCSARSSRIFPPTDEPQPSSKVLPSEYPVQSSAALGTSKSNARGPYDFRAPDAKVRSESVSSSATFRDKSLPPLPSDTSNLSDDDATREARLPRLRRALLTVNSRLKAAASKRASSAPDAPARRSNFRLSMCHPTSELPDWLDAEMLDDKSVSLSLPSGEVLERVMSPPTQSELAPSALSRVLSSPSSDAAWRPSTASSTLRIDSERCLSPERPNALMLSHLRSTLKRPRSPSDEAL